ncbi:FAD-binding domain-containing protein [Paraphoma chrysanthemicola]|uniref:FAD-binding domain-containing protein n=1 Tax=Paraphoma chrysanthemicola TaxID=798071 RepID=A0A8K0W4C2_9PLEO|nr:FAD-binding domain-containing protein [Paraphoma chrysanthemicola]
MQDMGNDSIQHLENNAVLILGGGPVGLLLAVALARYGVRSIILERNLSTTKWPKMDLTNSRSMELLRRLGLTEGIRNLGVPATTPYHVYMITGLHNKAPIASWEFPCVEDLRDQYREENDGTSPQEPWQRISQAVFESYLKKHCEQNPLIDCRFGWKAEKITEAADGVSVMATDLSSQTPVTFFAKYVVACDGASSRTRRDLQIPLEGGPIPGYALLVHFKSRDLSKLFKLGRFWHLFIFGKSGLHGAVICQDDKEIFTTHLLLPLDADHESIDSYDAVYRTLGGSGEPFKVAIDEIIVRSAYRHSVAVARSYRSSGGRVFLAGDSAHQNIPTGGYGMNMGIGDAYDIAWKLAAVVQHNGSHVLLESYEQERRPVALQAVQRSRVHHDVHTGMVEFLAAGAHLVEEDSDAGKSLREKIQQHYTIHNGENTDTGVEMDHRHVSSIYPPPSPEDGQPPSWDPSRYAPSTFIGCRAPHVYLKNGDSIFDYYGPHWTLIQFEDETHSQASNTLLQAAQQLDLPLKHVILKEEQHAQQIWKVPLVLVRPDGHVAWRGHEFPTFESALAVINIVGGWKNAPLQETADTVPQVAALLGAGSQVVDQVADYKLDKMGVMQQ